MADLTKVVNNDYGIPDQNTKKMMQNGWLVVYLGYLAADLGWSRMITYPNVATLGYT